MAKLHLRPNSDGYTYKPGNEVAFVETEVGSRSRRDFNGAVGRVRCSWTLDELKYDYFWAFFHTQLSAGTLSFTMDLLTDKGLLQEHTCKFIPGSISTPTTKGASYFIIGAELEVVPIARDATYDAALIDLYEEIGDTMDELLALLAQLVNVDMPAAW